MEKQSIAIFEYSFFESGCLL